MHSDFPKLRPALCLAALLTVPALAGENAFDRGSLAGGFRARWRVALPAPQVSWMAPGEAPPPPGAAPEVALRFEGAFQEGGPREHLELVLGESTPRALYLAARTRVSFEVLVRFNRRDSEPFVLEVETKGTELAVRCEAYGIDRSVQLYGNVPLRGTASFGLEGGATAELLGLESAPLSGELPPPYREPTEPPMRGPSAKRAWPKRYSPGREESP